MKIKTLSLLRNIAWPSAALAMMSTLAFPLANAGTTPPFTDTNWVSMGGLPGANGAVLATLLDGSGNLYVGGRFTAIGDAAANCIAKWDGTNWTALGSGIDGGAVNALALSGNDLYAGGSFHRAGEVEVSRVAKWDGTNWSALSTGVEFEGWSHNTAVLALAASGSDLYVGGRFTRAGGLSANHIARWNGSSWSALGTGISLLAGPGGTPEGGVNALAMVGSDLYAGGIISGAGGVSANHIAKWNGSAWSAVGSGVDGGASPAVYSLATFGTDLYVAGAFETAGGIPARYIAKWNGSEWSTLGTGPDASPTSALAVSGGVLYAGMFGWVRRWNGSSWIELGPRIHSSVTALAVTGSVVYAGGSFTSVGGSPAHFLARWNGSTWSVPGRGRGLDGPVRAIATVGNNVYVGGEFTQANGIAVNRIAGWNGTNWSALGPGLDHHVNALAVAGNLYALGTFTNAGSTRVDGFARWNGGAWTAFGGGRNPGSRVQALAAIGNNLYVGGNFTSIGGNAISNLARWNGGSWSSVGGALNGEVYKLAASGTNLYVAGAFTTAGGIPANRIAKWNGSTWSPLGSDLSGLVTFRMAASDAHVYVSGWNTISKWDGTTWTQLPFTAVERLFDLPIDALAAVGGDLYIGGSFNEVATPNFVSRVNYIAKWDGSSLSMLGSGMNNTVSALVISGNTLFAGGDFTIAGGKVSAYLAKANLPVAPGQFESWTYSPGTGLNWTFTGGTVGRPYRVQASTSLAPGSWVDFTNFTYAAPTAIRDASAISGSNRFFRAVSP